jgi:hypothetical protein
MTREQQIIDILNKNLPSMPNKIEKYEQITLEIMQLDAFRPGTKVMYAPEHAGCDMSQWEKGIVKDYGPKAGNYFVVYHCGGDWDNYRNFTAALTDVSDLRLGWREVE